MNGHQVLEGDNVPLRGLPSEAVTKEYLDHLEPSDLARLATYEEAWRTPGRGEEEETLQAYLAWRARGGHDRWDSVQGVFARSDPS